MKIKPLLNLVAIALLVAAFTACKDDIYAIGDSIQPEGDDIFVGADTVTIKAETISLKDSIYARTTTGSLGEYIDPVFGKIKSDFLSELYCPENTNFHTKTISVDSVILKLTSTSFTGDSISPIGISVYQVTNPLTANFFTNVDPSKYCNMSIKLGEGVFTMQDAPKDYDSGSKTLLRDLDTRLDRKLGQSFYNEWVRSGGATFKNSDELKKFFNGVYITTSFGSGTLINVGATTLGIYYSYTGRNSADTADSTRVSLITFPVTPEVIQMNHVQNANPENLFTGSDTKTYLKSPAGVVTELTIPLKEIMDKAEKKGGVNAVLNAADFKLVGFTEEEEKTQLNRPSQLLFVNKDSLQNFFLNRKKADGLTSFLMTRTSNNSYAFNYNSFAISSSNPTGIAAFTNIAGLINHYIDYYKNKETVPDLKYLVIPITTTSSYSQTSSGQTIRTFDKVYNQMTPSTAILRTDDKNMKMPLVISKYNTGRTK